MIWELVSTMARALLRGDWASTCRATGVVEPEISSGNAISVAVSAAAMRTSGDLGIMSATPLRSLSGLSWGLSGACYGCLEDSQGAIQASSSRNIRRCSNLWIRLGSGAARADSLVPGFTTV